MDLPKNIAKVVKKVSKPLQTKTFIFEMENVADADDTVNAFCSSHDTLSIVLDRQKDNLIYRVIYRGEK